MCTKCIPNIQTTDVFGEKLLDIMNGGALALMISIGHRTGLFETLHGMTPATSAEIANAAGLNERYVREWLGAMTTGGIVLCDPDGLRYQLPDEHAALLIEGPDNIAMLTQYIGLLGTVEDQIIDCFRQGGGVPYEAYGRFSEVMAEDSGMLVVHNMLDKILPLMPGMRGKLERGIRVLDCGCGRGKALNLLARTFPNSEFVGYDLLEDQVAYARNEAAEFNLTNIRFEVRDLSTFDADAEPEAFDWVATFDAVHDQGRPDNLLAGIHRTLRPGGTYLMVDITGSSNVFENMDHPIGPLIYTISCMHCMTVSLAAGGMGLGAMWGRQQALAMLADAGFDQVTVNNLDHDVQNTYYVVEKK